MRRPFLAAFLSMLVAGSLSGAALGGCGSVPDIRFVDEAATSSEGGAKDGTTGPDTGRDGPGPDGGCPPPAPGDGFCCGSVWCFENQPGACSSQCADCALCPSGNVCCAKGGAVQCKDKCP